jgi:hypothetical protein
MPRSIVDTGIDVIVVVSLMLLAFPKTASITKVPSIPKVLSLMTMVPIVKVTEIIKIMVEVPEEEDRCKPDFKR